MSERGPFETRATAIHEAGHAVAAAIYGPAGWTVTIREGERREGGLDFDESRWADREEVEDWIDRCLVGRWAEWTFRREYLEGCGIVDGDARWTTTSNMVRDAAENDYILAKDYAVHCGLATKHDFQRQFNAQFWVERDARARQFVKCWRDPIMRVADQLELHVELRDDQVRQIVRRTRPVAFLVKRLRNLIGASRRLLADPRA